MLSARFPRNLENYKFEDALAIPETFRVWPPLGFVLAHAVAATEVAVGAEAKVAVEVEVTEITIEVVVAAAEVAEGDIIVAIDRIKRVHL